MHCQKPPQNNILVAQLDVHFVKWCASLPWKPKGTSKTMAIGTGDQEVQRCQPHIDMIARGGGAATDKPLPPPPFMKERNPVHTYDTNDVARLAIQHQSWPCDWRPMLFPRRSLAKTPICDAPLGRFRLLVPGTPFTPTGLSATLCVRRFTRPLWPLVIVMTAVACA